ncbi:MAG TPA: galactosyldiacylglycerol synthase [Candidatus Limnocylindria bacterium]|jgi:hypothetical protein
MIDLHHAATNELIGSISEAELQTLVSGLEEESLEDRDYYVDAATIEFLAAAQADAHLLELLRGALGASDGIDIRWERRSGG